MSTVILVRCESTVEVQQCPLYKKLFIFVNIIFLFCLSVCGRTPKDHSLVVPTHSVAWVVEAADRPPVDGWACQSSVGNCRIGTRNLHAFRSVLALRLSSSELKSRKFLLGHSASSSSLLFLFNLFGTSVEVEMRPDLPWVLTGGGTTHAQNFVGQHPPLRTCWVSSLVSAWDCNVHIAQRGVCVAQSNGKQIIQKLLWESGGQPGDQ